VRTRFYGEVFLKNTGPCGLLMGRLPANSSTNTNHLLAHFICRIKFRQDLKNTLILTTFFFD
jgi:hypothetical protein